MAVQSLGIDIGGTSIKAGIVGPEGVVGDIREVPTPSDPDDIIDATLALAKSFPVQRAAGVAVAAFLDPSREHVEFSPNIAWEGRPLRQELEQGLQLPVVLENDANAAGFGEYLLGAGRNAPSMVMLTLGTGVGGAVILDGNLLSGARGVAGELGHLVVNPGGAVCGCGQRGCVETVSSGTALMTMAAHALGIDIHSPQALEEALAKTPEVKETLLKTMAEGIIGALLHIQAVVDPAISVIGGGVTQRLGSDLFVALDRAQHDRLEARRSVAFPHIVVAQLGNSAGIIGAGLLAQQRSVDSAH